MRYTKKNQNGQYDIDNWLMILRNVYNKEKLVHLEEAIQKLGEIEEKEDT